MINNKCVLKTIFILLTLTVACQQAGKEEKEIIKETGNASLNKMVEGMIKIPAGEFIMGSNEVDKEMIQQRFGMRKIPYQNEHPERKINLGEYYIDQYEVTNKEYKVFVDATQYPKPPFWINGIYPEGQDRMPVVMVNWFAGDAYCRWRDKKLPTEVEWEKAARGVKGIKFPYGEKFIDKKANVLGLSGGVSVVDQFKEDVSPYGVYGMTGNVSEWISEWYKGYPGNNFIDSDYGEKRKVLRGGSWGGIGHYSFELFYRTSFRNSDKPEMMLNDVGFRCTYSEN